VNPTPIRELHQIEVTSRCNLKCVYCPSKDIYKHRPMADMERAVFERALVWAKHCQERNGQTELNLAGTGESTLHPDFVEYVARAREVLGPKMTIVFPTNGLLFDDAYAARLAPYGPRVYVSTHRPEKAGPAIEAAKKYGLFAGISVDSSVAAVNWAGQVDWFVSSPAKGSPCSYLSAGWGFVLSDGRLSTCSFDAFGIGVIGHVNDEIGTVMTQPYSLCRTCHYRVPATK
jgi:hypothetical protein